MTGDLIHVRTIAIEIDPESHELRAARGRICDRRHQGYTYTGSQVIGPGVVHDMSARLTLDMQHGSIRAAESSMERAAFDGSAETRFESCRDVLQNVAQLAGLTLDPSLATEVRHTIGRERGCYHLTNLWLAIASLATCVFRDRPDPRRAISRRLELTAREGDRGQVRLSGTLVDAQAGDEHEARALLAFTIDPATYVLDAVEAHAAPDLRPASDVAAALDRLPLMAGFTRSVVDRLAPLPHATELLDLALGLNAIVTQAMLLGAPEAQADPTPRAETTRALGTCFMWRPGGPVTLLPTGRLRDR